MTTSKTALVMLAMFAVALGLIAWASPAPDRVTDRGLYEATAAQVIVPDCSDLQCFRVLVPVGPRPAARSVGRAVEGVRDARQRRAPPSASGCCA